MNKLPAELQHKIDYIKALDIPVEQKYQRIGSAMIIYSESNKRAKISEATDRPGPPNLRPLPPPMPHKRVICEDVKIMDPAPVDYNAGYVAAYSLAAFILCGAVGLMLCAILEA